MPCHIIPSASESILIALLLRSAHRENRVSANQKRYWTIFFRDDVRQERHKLGDPKHGDCGTVSHFRKEAPKGTTENPPPYDDFIRAGCFSEFPYLFAKRALLSKVPCPPTHVGKVDGRRLAHNQSGRGKRGKVKCRGVLLNWHAELLDTVCYSNFNREMSPSPLGLCLIEVEMGPNRSEHLVAASTPESVDFMLTDRATCLQKHEPCP